MGEITVITGALLQRFQRFLERIGRAAGRKSELEMLSPEEKVDTILSTLTLEELQILTDKLMDKPNSDRVYTLYDFVE